MRYIKSINESVELMDSVRTFTRNHLANLTDNKFIISVLPIFNDDYPCRITIHKSDIYNTEISPYNTDNFKWNDIKDDFIPFLMMLVKNYQISKITILYETLEHYGENEYGVGNLLTTGIPDRFNLSKISIKVKKESYSRGY